MLRIIFAYLLALIAAIFGLWSWQKTREEEIRNERLNDEIRRLNSANMKNSSAEKCTVCLSNPFEILFQPCGHVCVCQDCARKLQKSSRFETKCPICRTVIGDSQRIYLS